MSGIHEMAGAHNREFIAQFLANELLVQGGGKQPNDVTDSPPQEGGKHQGIVRDERGQEQPTDKERAQRVSRTDKGGDPPGKKS